MGENKDCDNKNCPFSEKLGGLERMLAEFIEEAKYITIKDTDGFEKTLRKDDFFQILWDKGRISFKKTVQYTWDWTRILQLVVTIAAVIALFSGGIK